ncbi:uncharacterized protein IUM83_16354 [Phytophthora cinnamomi]|uniref:uncharacterized protein n=1 Tax=Phytophthora cinnamomi TaxID=4785 RepID=UPI0035594B60|nr:hypothetical protein IUM83_16354 [Phytophthora cinnamomi]
MGALVLHESEADVPLEDAMALATKWGEILRRGGLQAAQDELLQRLLSCILRLEDDEQSQETLRFLLERGALPLLVQYTARNKPTEPRRLQQLVQSYVKLLEAATRTGQTELHLSLVTLAQTLAHLKQQQDDTVNYVDMLQLGAALTKVQQLAHERLEEGADASRAFAVYRSDLEDSDFSRVAESCTALVELCSPEMPDSMKKFGLWSMSTLVQAVGQEDSSALRAKQLEAALGPKFATNLLELPRSGDEENLQLQAATVLDRLLHVARQYPATVSRVSGKQFLGDIRRWCEIEDPMQRSNYFRVVENLRAYDEVVATGHLAKDVYCEGVHPIVSQGIVEQCTDDEPAMPKVDVVFVHGLRGHPFGTWRTDMSNKLEGTNDIWPDVLLARDLQRSGVPARLVTLGYEAGMVSWSSPWPSLTLQERARVMLSALYAAYIGRCRPNAPARPVIFITHSMGGLLTKQMLLVGREQRVRSSLADNTAGVVFLAVPHFGSDLAKGVRSESIRKLIQAHPAIADLGADPNGRLKDLNDSFKQLGIDCFSVGEERAAPVALGLSAVVVKPESADPGIGRFYVLPDSDHMTICKAKSREEPLYQDILAYILHAAGHILLGPHDE